MNLSPELLPILADLQKRFRNRIEAVRSPRTNVIYVHAKMDLVPGFTAHLCRNCEARLVSLFADDARQVGVQASACSGDRLKPELQPGGFHLYYVFALDAAGGFIILRVPVPPDRIGRRFCLSAAW